MKKYIFTLICLLLAIVVKGDRIADRQAFFKKISENPALLKQYLSDKDPEIRRYVVYLAIKADPLKNFDIISEAIKDSDKHVRQTAVMVLPQLAGKDRRVKQLLEQVVKSEKDQTIRQIAVAAAWPFHREIKLLRNDPSWDYEVNVVKSLPLEKLPWRFVLDPLQDGHSKGFFKREFDTSKWSSIKMGNWENQGFADYDGTAWYQIKFVMPPKQDCNAVEIHFDAVDESAWVWLNGVYLGAHDVGPEGWNKPFAVSCTSEIIWGKENVLTVRVYDAAFAGGIYKPLRVEILK